MQSASSKACKIFILGSITLAACVGCSDPTAKYPPNMTVAMEIRDSMGGAAGADSGADAFAGGPQPTGWATLTGQFKLVGSAPSPSRLNIEKDTEVCAPGGRDVFSEELLVDSSGGIKNVVIYLDTEIPGEEPWTHPDAIGKTEPVEFDQKECVFLTHVMAMQTTQPLNILNSDPVGHNAKLSPKENGPFNQIIPAGSAAPYQPTSQESGPFDVACSIHPWMKAYILIRDNGYFAVSNEDGSFEIPNLPTGVDLQFRVWQEKSKYLGDVSVNGQSTSWKKGRFTLRLDPEDATKNQLDVAVDLAAFE